MCVCVCAWGSSSTSFPPCVFLLSSHSPLSSLTLLLIRQGSFHYLLRLGCQFPRPWPKFVVLRRRIGEMISGVIFPPLSPPLHSTLPGFHSSSRPPCTSRRGGDLLTTIRLLLVLLLLLFTPHTVSPIFHSLILHHVASLHPSKCPCSLLSQIHFNVSLLSSPPLYWSIKTWPRE